MLLAIGLATSSLAVPTDGNGLGTAGSCVKIVGTKATVTVSWPPPRPTEYTVHSHEKGKQPERHVVDIPGKGLHWQADATARAISISQTLLTILIDRRWEIGKRRYASVGDSSCHEDHGSSQRDRWIKIPGTYRKSIGCVM